MPSFTTSTSATADAPDQPDWSQFVPGAAQGGKPEGSFYERCMLGGNPRVTIPGDQEALCACMAARQEELQKTAPQDQPWLQTLNKEQQTPFQIFSTKIFAPCMYLEGRDLGLRECYAQSHYAVLFRYQQNYDAYCSCYADNATDYMRMYAEPLIAAHIADPHMSMVPSYGDPTLMVLEDYDYRNFMEKRRQECADRYALQPAQ